MVRVSVELRSARSKLYAQASFETDAGPLVVDHIYVKRHGQGYRPRVDLPARPDGQLWLPVMRLPPSWYEALVDAVDAALRAEG